MSKLLYRKRLFKNLQIYFSSQRHDGCINVQFHKKITDEQRQASTEPFTNKEIKQVVFQMEPSKAPEPDDFGAYFFQKYWDIIGPNICRIVKEFFHNGFKRTKPHIYSCYQRIMILS